MSNSNNNRMIVFASIIGAILATSILALNPSTITNAGAQLYEDQYGYDEYLKKSSHTDIQKINCVNSNINVNGIDITRIPQDNAAIAAGENEGTAVEGANTQNGNGLDGINFERNLVNICANVNVNKQIKVSPPTVLTNLDLAVANINDDDVSIRLGNGDGTFTSTAPDVTVGNVPSSIAVGLFNADSNLDLAVANRGDDDVSIRLGNGDGTFTSTAPDVTVGDEPSSIAVGLFNADSNLDLAVANFVDDDVSIRLGNGDGTFTSTAPDVTVGDAPISIAVGDFDNT